MKKQLRKSFFLKKCAFSTLLFTGLLGLTKSAHAQTYAPFVTNPFNLIGHGSQIRPTFVDLDNDGDMDIVTATNAGNSGSSFVYYENTGTNIAPNYSLPQENPFPIHYIGPMMAPTFVDIDNDGDFDLFTGSSDGQTHFIENRGTASSPAFSTIVSGAFGINAGGPWSSNTFADLDNDGDFDVLASDYYGNLNYFPNIGSATAPQFGSYQSFPFGLTNTGNSPRPRFIDMDNDGDMDILIGLEYGNFSYFENTGTISAPAFAPAVTNPFGLSHVGYSYTAPIAADLDGDGDLDILVAGSSNEFKYFENITPLPQPPAPKNITNTSNLLICNGTSTSLTAKGIPIGKLMWYDAPTNGNRIGTGYSFVTPVITTNTTFYVQDSTAGGISASRTAIQVTVSRLVANQSVSPAQTAFCVNGTTTITLGSSETGVNYYLRNDLNDTIISGPFAGTGNPLGFNTGTFSISTTYNVMTQTTTGPNALVCLLEMTQTPTIAVKPIVTASVSVNVCYGTDYTYADGTIATDVIANAFHISTLTARAANGCDSIVTEYITSLPQLTGSETATICAEESITINGTIYNSTHPSGTEIFTNIGIHGCDSTVTVNLNVLPALTSSITTTICAEESITVNGTVYNSDYPSGIEIFPNIGSNGCDSTVTVNLNVLPALASSITTTICAEESITVNGTVYNAAHPSGTEIFPNIGVNGCDSTVTVNLNILPALASSITSICDGESITVNGTVYNAEHLSGTEVFTNVGAYGCDSTVTINLTVKEPIDITVSTNVITMTSNETGANYQWIDCVNEVEISGATSQSFTATTNGSYAVFITKDGCSEISECIAINTVGITELQKNQFAIYPNPTADNFTISGLEVLSNIREISLLDVNGKYINFMEQTATTWDVSNVSPGMYYVRIVHEKGVETIKFLKK